MLPFQGIWAPALGLLALIGAPQESTVTLPLDPEENPKGRQEYMGRDIARTMHWRGADWLLRKTREDEENGKLLRAWLDLPKGTSVADVGCGNGYHTLPLAKAVGATGKVFAVDLQPEMLDLLEERAKDAGIDYMTPIVATVDDPKLPRESCDVVLMVDVYHELSHPVRVLNVLRRSLTEDGVVVLVEFRAEDRSVPIKVRHKMTKAQVIAEMGANGFKLAAETDSLPWQHAMAFEAAELTPTLEASVMADGFVAALNLDDPRVAFPFLADRVDLGDVELAGGKELSIEIGKWMRSEEAPLIPKGTRANLGEPDAGWIRGTLTPPKGETLWQGRSRVGLRQDEDGVWRLSEWLAPK